MDLFRVQAWALAAALGLNLSAQLVTVIRWASISACFNFTFPLKNFFGWYFAGMFSSIFLPSNMGGDALRIIWLSAPGGLKDDDDSPSARRWRAGAAVLWDRFLGLVALMLMAIPSLLGLTGLQGAPLPLPDSIPPGLIVGIIVAGAAVIIGLMSSEESRVGNALRAAARQAGRALWTGLRYPWHTALHAAYSFAIQLLGCLAVWSLARGLAIEVSLPVAIDLFVFSSLAAIAPISLNGAGLREGIFAWYFQARGWDPVEGALLGLIFTASHTLVSLTGSYSFYRVVNRKPTETPRAQS